MLRTIDLLQHIKNVAKSYNTEVDIRYQLPAQTGTEDYDYLVTIKCRELNKPQQTETGEYTV